MAVSWQAIRYMLVWPAFSYRIMAEKRPRFWPLVITTLPGLAVIPSSIQAFQPVIPPEVRAEILGPGDPAGFLLGGIAVGAILGTFWIKLLQAGLAALFLTCWSSRIPFRTLINLAILSSSPYLVSALVGVFPLKLRPYRLSHLRDRHQPGGVFGAHPGQHVTLSLHPLCQAWVYPLTAAPPP